MHLQYCIICIDDIIVFSKTPEEHLIRLSAVFEKLKKAELKLKPSKCEFFKQELTYLGHVVGHVIDGWCQPMSLKCKASLGLPIIIEDQICTGGQTPVQINFWGECSQETEFD